MQFATEYKKSLPITNADGSEIFDAEYGRFFIRIKTVLKSIKITEVDIASFDYSMRSAYDATCEDTGTKKALLNGIDFLYAYYDQDKSLISEHSLTAFCGKRAK